MTDLLDELRLRGGGARFRDLPCSRAQVRAALETGQVIRVARGRYALAQLPLPQREALRLDGALSHLSAAAAMGWSLLEEPQQVHVSVPRGRKSPQAGGCQVHFRDLGREEWAARLTSPLTTVLDCARTLPFDQAVAVADSALRTGVGSEELIRAAHRLRGNGCAQALAVAEFATPLAANAFESGARVVAHRVCGLHVAPQVVIRVGGMSPRVDLADPALGLVIECDGYAFHNSRERFVADRRRYTRLVAAGWTVFTLVWEDVVVTPQETEARLQAWVDAHG